MKELLDKYDFASGSISENRRIVLKDGKIGFVDEKGQEVIKPQFIHATDFESGYSIVSFRDNTVAKSGIIDKNGNIIFKDEDSYIKQIGKNLFNVTKYGYCYVIDNMGDVLVSIKNHFNNICFYPQENLFVARDCSAVFILDKDGKILKSFPVEEYEYFQIIDSHIAMVDYKGIVGIVSF